MTDWGIPKYCPIDGSELEIIGGTFVCQECSHNWEIKAGESGSFEFYAIELTGY